MNGNFALGQPTADAFAKAASGDRGTQREMVAASLGDLRDSVQMGGFSDLAAYEALFWARLTATGGERDDMMLLATTLAYASDALVLTGREALAEALLAETLSIVEVLAEQGDEQAAIAVNTIIGHLPQSVIDEAKALKKEMPE